MFVGRCSPIIKYSMRFYEFNQFEMNFTTFTRFHDVFLKIRWSKTAWFAENYRISPAQRINHTKLTDVKTCYDQKRNLKLFLIRARVNDLRSIFHRYNGKKNSLHVQFFCLLLSMVEIFVKFLKTFFLFF